MIIGQQLAKTFQLTRDANEESPKYVLQSSRRVFDRNMRCLLDSIIVIIPPMFLLGTIRSFPDG
ncbi:MAG: hypothetical protein M3Z05_22400 [Gemmatimonadota bacterium]|nr:hypothetical protein [Gemmatimonadota bacterium]